MSKTSKIYYLLALIPSFMGAISYILSKYVINDISPIALLFYRWFIALIILTPFALKQFLNEFKLVKSNISILTIISIFGVTLFNFFVYYSVQYTTSTNVSIIISIFPVFVLAFGVIIGKEAFNKVQLYSIILSFIGATIIVGHGNIFDNLLLFENIGDFIALCASFCWAAYVIAVKYKPTNLSFLSFTYSTILIGTTMIAPIYAIDILHLKHTFAFNLQNISVILCLSIGVSIIGLMTLNISIIKIGANTSSLLLPWPLNVGIIMQYKLLVV